MACTLNSIRELVELANRKDITGINVHRKGTDTKFKLRAAHQLYTLTVSNPEMADKIVKTLPPHIDLTKNY